MSQPQSLPPPRPSTNQQALEQASLALQGGRPDEAERLAGQVLKADRGNLPAARLLGAALLQLNRPAEAVDMLSKAARRSQDPAVETLLAQCLAAQGRGEDALNQFRQAASRRPPYPAAFLELGLSLGFGQPDRTDEAIAILGEGLKLAPEADGLRIALGHVQLKRNDRAAARTSFAEVHKAAPGRPDAMIGLAKVLELEGDDAAAADLYARALAARPDDASTRIALGKCLLELGRREAGEAAIREGARASSALTGQALTALAAAAHGRLFLRRSAAAEYLGVRP